MNNISVNLEKTCSGCGLCESICPVKAISVKEKKGFFRPEINNSCINCGKCVLNCPGRNTNQITSFEMFKYRYYGHSNNDKLRKEAASGGLTTKLIKYMLSTGIVDYVITAGEYQNDKNLGYVIIDNQNIDDLDRYSGSNYCPANIGRAIGKIKENNGRYAIVCLPCLARGIFLARKADKLLDSRIKYVITLLCNHIPSYEGTDYLIKRYRIDIPKMIKYRGNGWFGSFRAYNSTENRTEFFSVPYSEYFSTKYSEYFWQRACVDCKDHFGIYADICMGDADFVKYRDKQENDGETIIFSNNSEIIEIIHRMSEAGLISLYSDINQKELMRIYEPLSDESRANDRNLRSGVVSVLLEEYLNKIWRKVKRILFFSGK